MRYALLGLGGALIIGGIIIGVLINTIRITPPKRTSTPTMEICHAPTGFSPENTPGQ